MYGDRKSAVDAAWDAVKGKDVVQVFTSGNNNRANPYHRALYPYFHPEAESQWIAISGIRQVDTTDAPDSYKIEDNFNEAGLPNGGRWQVRDKMVISRPLIQALVN